MRGTGGQPSESAAKSSAIDMAAAAPEVVIAESKVPTKKQKAPPPKLVMTKGSARGGSVRPAELVDDHGTYIDVNRTVRE